MDAKAKSEGFYLFSTDNRNRFMREIAIEDILGDFLVVSLSINFI